MSNPSLLVVGAGPGISGAVARRFATEGYDVALIGLLPDQLAPLAVELAGTGVEAVWAEADVTDAGALTTAVRELAEQLGQVDVLHFNPSAFRQRTPLTLSVAELLDDVALGVGALLTSVQAARPYMATGSRVTATGSMAADKPWHEAASLGVQKAALRNLVRSLDRTVQPDGIRAVSVTVQGTLERDDESSPFHPRQVAEAIYAAAVRPDADWTDEVSHPS
ncbi:MAG TPA: SDR family oxidoreductase [Marmoricola sp.]|nr:SDR family oxidoreductase [Marmoricola sp.]